MLKEINLAKTNDKEVVAIAGSISSQSVSNRAPYGTGGNGDQTNATQSPSKPYKPEQETTSSTYGYACSVSRRGPENDGGIGITFSID